MRKSKTYFEQVPLEVVQKIVRENVNGIKTIEEIAESGQAKLTENFIGSRTVARRSAKS